MVWRKRIALALLSALSLQPSALFSQGSLTPPGAPAPTMKTLDQVEPRVPIESLPFTINASGSYYLTRSLTLTSSTFEDGVTVAANNVSIDLKGFALTGRGDTGSGVSVPDARTNVTVRDGTLQGWSFRGVDASQAINCQLLRLLASDNGDSGISAGSAGTVMQCTGVSNGYAGILTSSGCVVQDCTAMFNANVGISANVGCTVSDCTSLYNIGGFSVSGGSVRGCSAEYNVEDGISVFQSTVLDCMVQANKYRGIVASDSSTVNRCTVRASGQHGIQVSGNCLISGNLCQQNGSLGIGAGILVLGSQNRIDGNHLLNNDYGLQVTATNNVIIRNSAQGNGTNFLFTGVQIFGPTNNLTGTGGVITNQNPWANFSF